MAKYNAIEQERVKKGFKVEKEERFQKGPLEAARLILEDADIIPF